MPQRLQWHDIVGVRLVCGQIYVRLGIYIHTDHNIMFYMYEHLFDICVLNNLDPFDPDEDDQ